MIHLDAETLNKRVSYIHNTNKTINESKADSNHNDVNYLMENDQAAIELQLNNLILTYGAAAIKKELNKQTRIKKAV